MSDIEIRLIALHEADEVGVLTQQAFLALDGAPLGGGYLEALAEVGARARDAVVLVAADGEQILGNVTYAPGHTNPYAEFDDEHAAGIRMLAVSPDAQGRGAGEALVVACLDRARAEGKARVLLHSTKWMPAAMRIYDRVGFVRHPAIDLTVMPGVDLIGYCLDLGRTL